MRKYTLIFLFGVTILSCKKEIITPYFPDNTANFSLADGAGICYTPVVQGTYVTGIPLNSSNFVFIQVNVTKTGTYSITTNLVNGFRFSGAGTFTITGLQTITLNAIGTPKSPGTNLHINSLFNSCSFSISVLPPLPPIILDNDHMYFGNPGNAAFTPDSANNYLMRKDHYALSYSRDRGIPNWVSWHLFASDIGTTSRQDDYREDNTLPDGWYRVQDASYSGAGFDRGHNTPSGDRTSSIAANSSTFLMTNMIPQAQFHNQIVWGGMEDSLRRLVSMGNEVYIIMGSYGMGGTGNGGFKTTIDGGKVTVPASIWKIAIVLPDGNNDSARVSVNTRVIAVDVPNTNTLLSNWKNYRTSVDAIETVTGYNLISKLPPSLQAVLESRIDNF
jgi:endonuclease G